MNIFRIEISNTVKDSRGKSFLKKIQKAGFDVEEVKTSAVYTISRDFTDDEQQAIGEILTNPVYESFSIGEPDFSRDFDWAIEVGFLPGVTDNVGRTVVESIEDLFKIKFQKPAENVFSSTLMYVKGENLSEEDAKKIGRLFANPLIQRISVKSREKFFADGGMDAVAPQVKLDAPNPPLEINLEIPDEELEILGKKGIQNPDGTYRGPLALSLLYLKTIRNYFRGEGRNPYDIELESIAQTWSEHCRHTIFANPINDDEKGIFKTYIKKATEKIRENKGENDFCVSVFSDNSGGIGFDDEWVITDKMETHNSPSALDPFGGAMTGIVGVNRDALGYGRGAKPVINRYGFCLGNPEKEISLFRGKNKSNPALQPSEIFEGIVAGIEEGGNQSGIPTPQGFCFFDDRYAGKPLVFAGTVGLIPRKLDGRDSSLKKAQPGDAIIVAGGRVGMDGIHGATFSSEALDDGSPATAVQIGDPITQKKLSDAVVRELREGGYINSVHDCGAGGISGTIGELGEEAGGFEVDLNKVPLKYPNLEPWQIWISESQERMTFSVPQEKVAGFLEIMKKHGVEATVLGKFTNSGRGQVFYNGEKIFDLSLEFLATGWPCELLKAEYQKPTPRPLLEEVEIKENPAKLLEKMLEQQNIAGIEFISQQYDHEVLGGSLIKPLQGKGRVNVNASAVRPVLSSPKAAILSHALNPKMTEINAYDMAVATIDDAIGEAVAIGGNVDYMAIMDNFCWCSSDEPERLGQLLETARGCYAAAVKYGTPFISGKDSMFNDFRGYDENNNPVKISVPPTLLISTLSVIPDGAKVSTIDFKIAGDKIFVLGETREEFGGSEFVKMIGADEHAGIVPKVNLDESLAKFRGIFAGHQKNLFASVQHIGAGGLGAALAKSCIAGKIGASVNLAKIHENPLVALFSESKSRYLISIDPTKEAEFHEWLRNLQNEVPSTRDEISLTAIEIGEVGGDSLSIDQVGEFKVTDLADKYKGVFGEY